VQPEVLELDGGLALHVHLAGKYVMMPPLPHSWSSHCISVAALQVLQVIIFVKQHPQSSLEWLACLNKVRIERMLVLHSCLVSTMPTMLLLGHHINAVLRG
jgi:hypothetical protein